MSPPKHPAPERCRDKECERPACVAWREGYAEGWADGYATGRSEGA